MTDTPETTVAEDASQQQRPAEAVASSPADDAAPSREQSQEQAQSIQSPSTVGDAISPEMLERGGSGKAPDLDVVMRIPVTLQAVLGQARMPIARLMKLGPGAVVPLDHKVGDPVDVMVNGRLVARGEVVLLEGEGERFGISLTEIVSPGSGC